MPTIPERKSIVTVAKAFRSSLETRTNLTHLGVDSKARAQLDTFTDQLIAIQNENVNAHRANSIATAVGEQLDAIGADMGVPRLNARAAQVTAAERNFAFYVSSGTFGDINGASGFTIPSGTKIYSEPNENELGSSIIYSTVENITIAAGDSVAYFAARADATGAESNLGPSVIQSHNFVNYADSANESLKVINFYAVLNGRREEKDDQYRFRLGRYYDRLLSANETKTLLSSLLVPGVLDIKTVPGLYGIGTTGIVVLGADYQSNADLIRNVQERIDSIYGPGGYAIATPAVSTKFDFSLQLRPLRKLNEREKANLELSVRRAIDNYFRTLTIGGLVDLRVIAKYIQKNTDGTLSFRRDNLDIFAKVFVRKGFASSASSDRVTLISNSYTLDEIEFGERGTLNFEYK